MPDRKQLAKYLRDLLTAQADVTATPQMPRQAQMTIGPRTGVRDPAPQSGPLAAIARSMAPSEDTPMGMVNEMLNPLRQGAAARELAGKAVGAIQRRELGKAAGMGALAAMSVPGVPGDEAAIPMKRTMDALKKMDEFADKYEGMTEAMRMLAGPEVPKPRMIENPAYEALFNRRSQIQSEKSDALTERLALGKLLRRGEEWRGNLSEARSAYIGAKDRFRSLSELYDAVDNQMKNIERYIPEPPQP